MKRDLSALTRKKYDVLVVGCGAYGAFAAREAALRGLSVAVIDRKDFCGATSANSLKIIHGGLRYLQQFDVARLLESARERRNLMRIAPHLVHPLPCAMPTRGYMMRSKPVLFLGMLLNDFLTGDRNQYADPGKIIPAGRVVSRSEFQRLVPGLDDRRFTGAAVWHDAYAYNTERLVVIAVKDAVRYGADAANYLEAVKFHREGRRVTGVVARDAFTGREITINAELVINNTGPWTNETLSLLGEDVQMPVPGLALELNFVLKRRLLDRHAVGLSGYRQNDGKERLLFFVPWHGVTMAGTYCRLHAGRMDRVQVMDQDIRTFLEDLNSAFPSAKLTRDDILRVHSGVLPIEEGSNLWPEPEPLKHFIMVDHSREDGIDGLFTVVGVKYTTARDVAEKTIDRVLRKLGKPRGTASESSVLPLPGGDISDLQRFISESRDVAPKVLSEATMTNLLYTYGTEHAGILELGKTDSALLKSVGGQSNTIAAEVVYAVREEMAQTLSDVVFGRTDLGALGVPGDQVLKGCAEIMARECGWDKQKFENEITELKQLFPRQVS